MDTKQGLWLCGALLAASFPAAIVAQNAIASGGASSPDAIWDRVSVTNNSGLQPAFEGSGLIGGGADYDVHFSTAGMRFSRRSALPCRPRSTWR
jgi:hypothetical protein